MSAAKYRVKITRKRFLDDWRWEVQRSDGLLWERVTSGTAMTQKRALKKGRNEVPLEIVISG